jgi:hypothetical protein
MKGPHVEFVISQTSRRKIKIWVLSAAPRHALMLLVSIPKGERKAPSCSQRSGQLSPSLACQQQNPIEDENGRYSHAFYVMRISSQQFPKVILVPSVLIELIVMIL